MMRRRLKKMAPMLMLLAVLGMAVQACGGSDSNSESGGSTSSTSASDGGSGGGEAVKTALVLPCPTSDPWCQQANDAAKALESEEKIELQVTANAPQDTAGVTRVMAQYAQEGTELLIAASTWQDAELAVAEQFPDLDIAGYSFETKENVAIFEEPIYQAAYLAGILAGGITKSNTIAGSAGEDVPLCHAELEAFKAGAESVNNTIKMLTSYIGDWNDAAKGKQASDAQIDQGADVLIACGGGPAAGMAQSIKAAGVSGFGYVGDMSSQAPENLVGNVIYNPKPYYEAAVEDVANETFRPGKTYNIGLAEGGVELLLNDGYSAAEIPADTMAEMEKVQEQIKSGKFEVPYNGGT